MSFVRSRSSTRTSCSFPEYYSSSCDVSSTLCCEPPMDQQRGSLLIGIQPRVARKSASKPKKAPSRPLANPSARPTPLAMALGRAPSPWMSGCARGSTSTSFWAPARRRHRASTRARCPAAARGPAGRSVFQSVCRQVRGRRCAPACATVQPSRHTQGVHVRRHPVGEARRPAMTQARCARLRRGVRPRPFQQPA